MTTCALLAKDNQMYAKCICTIVICIQSWSSQCPDAHIFHISSSSSSNPLCMLTQFDAEQTNLKQRPQRKGKFLQVELQLGYTSQQSPISLQINGAYLIVCECYIACFTNTSVKIFSTIVMT